jgi:hypothetical protein
MKDIRETEQVWGVTLPEELKSFVNDTRDACRKENGEIINLPFPPLTFTQIIAVHSIAQDWNIRAGLVPIMGDFHDFVCLDYRDDAIPVVVLIDDYRNERTLFNTFGEFFTALCLAPERTVSSDAVIQDKSWLKF